MTKIRIFRLFILSLSLACETMSLADVGSLQTRNETYEFNGNMEDIKTVVNSTDESQSSKQDKFHDLSKEGYVNETDPIVLNNTHTWSNETLVLDNTESMSNETLVLDNTDSLSNETLDLDNTDSLSNETLDLDNAGSLSNETLDLDNAEISSNETRNLEDTTSSSNSTDNEQTNNQEFKPRDCADIMAAGNEYSGVYTIYPVELPLTQVYCDLYIDGGGWTVFQRRKDGSVDFNRTWAEYRDGFGNLDGEFWLGNGILAEMTGQGREYELRIDMANWRMDKRFAQYDSFRVLNESENFRLILGYHYGNTDRNSMFEHNNRTFSTFDHNSFSESLIKHYCPQIQFSGFWFCCSHGSPNQVLPNNLYDPERRTYGRGVSYVTYYWFTKSDAYTHLKFIEMKIRPLSKHSCNRQ